MTGTRMSHSGIPTRATAITAPATANSTAPTAVTSPPSVFAEFVRVVVVHLPLDRDVYL